MIIGMRAVLFINIYDYRHESSYYDYRYESSVIYKKIIYIFKGELKEVIL